MRRRRIGALDLYQDPVASLLIESDVSVASVVQRLGQRRNCKGWREGDEDLQEVVRRQLKRGKGISGSEYLSTANPLDKRVGGNQVGIQRIEHQEGSKSYCIAKLSVREGHNGRSARV